MTLATTYEAIKHETSSKLLNKGKPAEFLGTGHQCKDGLLPSFNSLTATGPYMAHFYFQALLKINIFANFFMLKNLKT